MKNLNLFYEDDRFEKMKTLKEKLGITWREALDRGLGLKGGLKDGNNKNK